jgi:predicted RNA-binding protein
MCIATVYENSIDSGKSIMQDVVKMSINNGNVLCKDILGEEKQFNATVKSIDFIKHNVVIEVHGK